MEEEKKEEERLALLRCAHFSGNCWLIYLSTTTLAGKEAELYLEDYFTHSGSEPFIHYLNLGGRNLHEHPVAAFGA